MKALCCALLKGLLGMCRATLTVSDCRQVPDGGTVHCSRGPLTGGARILSQHVTAWN